LGKCLPTEIIVFHLMLRDTTACTVMAKGIKAESMVMAEESFVTKVDIMAGMVMVVMVVMVVVIMEGPGSSPFRRGIMERGIMERGIMEGLATVEDTTVGTVMAEGITHMVMAGDIIQTTWSRRRTSSTLKR
jgi:hypothetical protein